MCGAREKYIVLSPEISVMYIRFSKGLTLRKAKYWERVEGKRRRETDLVHLYRFESN